jgi:hypothetical protein
MSLDQLINWEKALEQFGFDELFYKELLGDLRDEMTYQIERMCNCVNVSALIFLDTRKTMLLHLL